MRAEGFGKEELLCEAGNCCTWTALVSLLLLFFIGQKKAKNISPANMALPIIGLRIGSTCGIGRQALRGPAHNLGSTIPATVPVPAMLGDFWK
jgi:hypothetical protein